MAASPSGRTSRATAALATRTRPGGPSGAGKRLDQGLGDIAVGHQVDDDPGPLEHVRSGGTDGRHPRIGRGRRPLSAATTRSAPLVEVTTSHA